MYGEGSSKGHPLRWRVMEEIAAGRGTWKRHWRELSPVAQGRVEDALREGRTVDDGLLRAIAAGKARRDLRMTLWMCAAFAGLTAVLAAAAWFTERDWGVLLPAVGIPSVIIPINIRRARRAIAANESGQGDGG